MKRRCAGLRSVAQHDFPLTDQDRCWEYAMPGHEVCRECQRGECEDVLYGTEKLPPHLERDRIFRGRRDDQKKQAEWRRKHGY